MRLATRIADELLTQARADAESLTSTARAEADQILASARNDAEQMLAALEESRARIRADTELLRQARWARREQLGDQPPAWLAEDEATEVG
jgi:cell division septum initiation protein DivIVA